jgi:hypothetical protein
MKNLLLTSMLVLSSIALVAQPKADKTDTKSDEQAIRSVSKKWLELTKNHDAAGCAALFANVEKIVIMENMSLFTVKLTVFGK